MSVVLSILGLIFSDFSKKVLLIIHLTKMLCKKGGNSFYVIVLLIMILIKIVSFIISINVIIMYTVSTYKVVDSLNVAFGFIVLVEYDQLFS